MVRQKKQIAEGSADEVAPKSTAPEPTAEAPEPEAPAAKSTKTGSVACVFDANGVHIRDYTLEIHGKEFRALAEQFAKKFPGARVDVS